VSVGDHQLCATKAAPHQLSEEGCPERFRFGDTNIEAEDLTPAIGVDPNSDGHRHRDDAASLAHFHIGGVEPT